MLLPMQEGHADLRPQQQAAMGRGRLATGAAKCRAQRHRLPLLLQVLLALTEIESTLVRKPILKADRLEDQVWGGQQLSNVGGLNLRAAEAVLGVHAAGNAPSMPLSLAMDASPL